MWMCVRGAFVQSVCICVCVWEEECFLRLCVNAYVIHHYPCQSVCVCERDMSLRTEEMRTACRCV